MMNDKFTLLKIAICFLAFSSSTMASGSTPTNPVKIWGGPGPGSAGLTLSEDTVIRDLTYDCTSDRKFTNVLETEIEPFVPTSPNGISVIVCPGGGYSDLSYDVEGTDIAEWLNSIGITAFVLKYRLPKDGHSNRKDVPLQDAQRALRTIRYNATSWGLEANKIGIMGFSAGGHLAACLGTMYDKDVYSRIDEVDDVSAKPNFVVLMYALISMEADVTHTNARENLLGSSITTTLINEYSAHMHVDENTPPTFLGTAKRDGSVDSENSERFNDACLDADVETEIHLYDDGRHGIGICKIRPTDTEFAQWTTQCANWINSIDFTSPVYTLNGDIQFVTYYNRNTDSINFKYISSSSILEGEFKFSILDLTGREIYSQVIDAYEFLNNNQISVSSLIKNSGLYIVALTHGSEVYSKKLIVTK